MCNIGFASHSTQDTVAVNVWPKVNKIPLNSKYQSISKANTYTVHKMCNIGFASHNTQNTVTVHHTTLDKHWQMTVHEISKEQHLFFKRYGPNK
jgi:hypothetical protein